jgi:hypothetical protein
VSVTVTVVVPAGRSATWARWSDVARWPEWNPRCLSASLRGPLARGTTVELQLRHPGGRDFWTRPVITAVTPEAELAWEARGLGLRAVTSSRLADEPDGTRLTVELDSRGPLAATYRLTLPDRTQARIWTEVLDALSQSLRPS